MRRLRKLVSTSPEFAWLGAEALPGGLVRASDQAESAGGVEWQEIETAREEVSPVGLLSLMRRLMNGTPRLN